jgi:hypothetical protein
MQWKCPQCGIQHDDILSECSCGYSAYKILGIKSGASAQEAKQAYKYLLTVWQTDRSSHDPASKKKAEERLKKINEAYEIFRNNHSDSSVESKKSSFTKIAVSAAVVIIILLGALAFSSNLFKTDEISRPQSVQKEVKADLPAVPAGQVNSSQASVSPSQEIPQTPLLPAINGEITEEKAIEMVKKSQALYRNTSTESLIKKWSEENAAKFQMVGWNARKVDEERYLVSFTAMDGALPKGFYFALDIRTGEVENLENKPELQKKYNIQYSK